MKQTLLFIAMFAFMASSFAQLSAVKGEQKFINENSTKAIQADSILSYYADRATGFSIYTAGGGYIFGNNTYYTETAMNYDGIANASLASVMFWVANKKIEGTANMLTVNCYAEVDDTTAGTVLGTVDYSMEDIDTTTATGGWNTISFANPIDLAGADFFVGINLLGDDTIGIVCNDPSANDGAGEKRSCVAYGGGWMSLDVVFGGLDADGMYLPVVDITTGYESMSQNGLEIFRAYPNPTSGISNIKYSIETTQNVKVNVFDLTGKVIYSQENMTNSGVNIIPVDFSSYPAGTYYYSIVTETAKITSKIAVVK